MSDLWFSEWKKMSVMRWANCHQKEFAHRSKRSLNSKERPFWAVRSLSDVTKFLGVPRPAHRGSNGGGGGGRGSRYAKIKMYLIYSFFKLILEPYAFYSFRIIFKAYCTALARQAAPSPSRVQSVSLSTYRGMLGAFAWTERTMSIRGLHFTASE